MRKITLLFVFIGLLSGCSRDDDSTETFNTPDEYGFFVKSTEDVEYTYKFYALDQSKEDGVGEVFYDEDNSINSGDSHNIVFRVTEKELKYDFVLVEINIKSGDSDGFTPFFIVKKSNDLYYVDGNESYQNQNASSIMEVNRMEYFNTGPGEESFMGVITLRDEDNFGRWVKANEWSNN